MEQYHWTKRSFGWPFSPNDTSQWISAGQFGMFLLGEGFVSEQSAMMIRPFEKQMFRTSCRIDVASCVRGIPVRVTVNILSKSHDVCVIDFCSRTVPQSLNGQLIYLKELCRNFVDVTVSNFGPENIKLLHRCSISLSTIFKSVPNSRGGARFHQYILYGSSTCSTID